MSMGFTGRIPGMRSGQTRRNLVVALLYVFLIPFALVVLPFYLFVVVGVGVVVVGSGVGETEPGAADVVVTIGAGADPVASGVLGGVAAPTRAKMTRT